MSFQIAKFQQMFRSRMEDSNAKFNDDIDISLFKELSGEQAEKGLAALKEKKSRKRGSRKSEKQGGAEAEAEKETKEEEKKEEEGKKEEDGKKEEEEGEKVEAAAPAKEDPPAEAASA